MAFRPASYTSFPFILMLGVRLMSMLGCALSESPQVTERPRSVLAQDFYQRSLAAGMFADEVCDIIDDTSDGSPSVSFSVVQSEL